MLYSSYYANKNPNPNYQFINWINLVEKKVLHQFGFNLLDLPDEDYITYFDNNYEPNQMVQIIKESNGFN